MAQVDRLARAICELCALAIAQGQASIDGAQEAGFNIDEPMFSVGVTARVTQMHPQTLRQYDRLGLIVPQRTAGGARRYCLRDIHNLTHAQQLTQDEGINLSGVSRILQLEQENRELKHEVRRLTQQAQGASVFTANTQGDIVQEERSSLARTWRRRGTGAASLASSRSLPSRQSGKAVAGELVVWRKRTWW